MADQRFVELSKDSDAESTVQLEDQLRSYQSSVEAAIRCLANIASTLQCDHLAGTPGQR